MGKFNDLTGQTFGDLLVISRIGINKTNRVTWLFRCKCGKEHVTTIDSIRKKNPVGCSSCNKKSSNNPAHSHGMTKTPTYFTWKAMIQRCNNSNYFGYIHWGGRGIKVCESWHKFENFLEDMGIKPEGLSLDRVNNDGNYEPGNCRWADAKTQASNRRSRNSV